MSLSTSNRLLALLIVTAPFAVIIGGLVTAAAIVITDRDAEPGSAIVDMTATPVPGISADDLISLGFSGLPPVTMPADNPLNEAKVKLGRMLFFG